MENQISRQFIIQVGLVFLLVLLFVTGCSPAETPPTAVPVVLVLTPTPTATLVLPSPTILAQTPTLTPTVARPTFTPSPGALTRQGDTLPTLSFTPGTPLAVFIVPCVVGPVALQLRSGPDVSYIAVKTLAVGTALSAVRSYQTTELWLLVQPPQQETGWVSADGLTCQGDLSRLPLAEGVSAPTPSTSTPTPAASPTPRPSPLPPKPTPTPQPPASPTLPPPSPANWRGEYYANPNLAGQPVLVRDDPTLDFNWGPASAGPEVPVDNFSVRWTRPFEFAEEGDYRFFADVDDGVKLSVDGWLVIDEWNTNPYMLHSGVFADIKPGVHTLTVEFFEAAGDAHVKVWFEKTLVSTNKWVGEYYNNPDFRDAAVLVREDDDIDFNWRNDAPASGMHDDFSVRWQRSVNLKAGDYEFKARLAKDDRVKIFLDDWAVLEENSDNGGTVTASFKNVGEGQHIIRVEYQDFSDEASLEVDWSRND